MTRVLALDIAAKASGAAFDGAEGRPAFATLRQRIEGDEFGPIGTKFRTWMLDLIAVCRPEQIALEAPWVPSGNRAPSHPTAVRVPRLLLGLAFLAEQIADECSIRCSETAVSTVRKAFLGHGRPDDPKAAVMRQCRLLGWNPQDDHQADAAALFYYAKATFEPKWAPGATPLFARAPA